MEPHTFHLAKDVDPSGGLVLEVEGYLDDAGAAELRREADAALAAGHRRIRIDLAAVVLFNCAGVRRLLRMLEEIEGRDGQVDLVGAHPPLQRLIDFAA